MIIKKTDTCHRKSNDAHRERIRLRRIGVRSRVIKVRTPAGCIWKVRRLAAKETPA